MTCASDEEYEVSSDLRWVAVARVAVEDVGNHPHERRAEVVREMWIEDELGRRMHSMDDVLAAARKVVDRKMEERDA